MNTCPVEGGGQFFLFEGAKFDYFLRVTPYLKAPSDEHWVIKQYMIGLIISSNYGQLYQ